MNQELFITIVICALFIAAAFLIAFIPVFTSLEKQPVKDYWRIYGYEVLIITAVLLPAYLGKTWFLTALLIFNLRAHYEIRQVKQGLNILLLSGFVFSSLLFVLLVFSILKTEIVQILLLAAALFMSLLSCLTGRNWAQTIWLLLVIYLSISCLLVIVDLDNGFLLIFFLYLLTESNDSFAYLAGKLFGRIKPFPSISPNKTLEGTLVGIVSAIFTGMIFNHYLMHWPPASLLAVMLLTIAAGIIGDLAFSKYKRELGIKDFPPVIKYHGGILDIYDSVLAASIIYYFLLPLIH